MKKIKKSSFYFLMKDILSCFPDKIGEHLIETLSSHRVSKDFIIQIFKDEVKETKPSYRILAGSIIILERQLIKYPRNFYNGMKILSELKSCIYQKQFKTIREWSAEYILRLFLSLWYEFIFLPPPLEAETYLKKFKKYVSEKDINNVINILKIFEKGNLLKGRIICEHHKFKFDIANIKKTRQDFNKILTKFYAS